MSDLVLGHCTSTGTASLCLICESQGYLEQSTLESCLQ